MPRLRSVRQGFCGPCKGPCFDNVLEGREGCEGGVVLDAGT
jgi:hypothetical protein